MKQTRRYREAGVDIEAGDRLVDLIAPYARSTARKGQMGAIGGFGGVFSIRKAGFNDPLLVSGTDGVGTKLKVAQMMKIHDTVGIDLVAMCVNDILTCGAEPLFFLDYYATGRLKLKVAQAVIRGVARGCKEAGCSLLGGETAEMPGFYKEDEYDLAGFTVGAVERNNMIDGSKIAKGDILIGLKSSGLHSNGYSLARKVFFEKMELSPDAPLKGLKLPIGKELLRPTRIYVKSVLGVLRRYKILGMAHITGGGIAGNVPRMIPNGLAAKIDRSQWRVPSIFEILAVEGDVDRDEMYETFNMGIGFVLIARRKDGPGILDMLKKMGEKAVVIGEIIRSEKEPSVIWGSI